MNYMEGDFTVTRNQKLNCMRGSIRLSLLSTLLIYCCISFAFVAFLQVDFANFVQATKSKVNEFVQYRLTIQLFTIP